MSLSKNNRFRIESLEDRLAPSGVVLGFNAHHDTVVTSGDGSVVLGVNAHHDTVVVNGSGQVVLGFNAHHNTVVVNGGSGCDCGCSCDMKSQPCC